jgi:hypothetical protein
MASPCSTCLCSRWGCRQPHVLSQQQARPGRLLVPLSTCHKPLHAHALARARCWQHQDCPQWVAGDSTWAAPNHGTHSACWFRYGCSCFVDARVVHIRSAILLLCQLYFVGSAGNGWKRKPRTLCWSQSWSTQLHMRLSSGQAAQRVLQQMPGSMWSCTDQMHQGPWQATGHPLQSRQQQFVLAAATQV